MTIDITKITNPIVRKALESRARYFMFNYGDGSGRHDPDTGEEYLEIHLFPRKPYQVKYEEHNEWYFDQWQSTQQKYKIQL